MSSVNASLCDIVNEIGKILINDPKYIEAYPQLNELVRNPGPNPPSLWTRSYTDCVNCQNSYCPGTGSTSSTITDYPPPVCQCPANGIYITPEQFDMRRKAEIFEYKKNASDQTKKQKYSLLAKGINIYRKRSWATQSEYYTNPNVNNLPRSEFTLVCGANDQADRNKAFCSPTTNNDVPGPIMNICYDSSIPLTNYVTRRIYTFNGTKWPQTAWTPGYHGFPVGKAGSKMFIRQ